MQNQKTYTVHFIVVSIALVAMFLINISLGQSKIPLSEILSSLTGKGSSKHIWEFIVIEHRLPKAITAIIAGGGLSVAGLIMQTMFRNPLADPFVLGLSSGASLGVALLLLGASAFGGIIGVLMTSQWSLVLAAAAGTLLVLLAVVAISVQVKDTMTLLIIGIMFGSFTSAIVGVLSYLSTAEQLQRYIFWSFGSLGDISWQGIRILSICFAIGIFLSVLSCKALNALLLGQQYAQSMGLNIKRTNLLLVVATSILAGSITAFAGPIAFVGLAVPHLTRQVFDTSNNFILMPAVLLYGATLLLLCDIIAQMPFAETTLPINAITSFIGAPIVIWLLVRKKKLQF